MGSFTQEQKSILVGSLLGDGYARIIPKRKNAFFEFNHGFKQKKYVDWKYMKLKEFVTTPPKAYKNNGSRIAYRFFTQQNEYFTELYKKFYLIGHKSVPDGLKLNPIILSVWFMDDGSKSYNTYYLNTQQFNVSSQEKLRGYLQKVFNIKSALNKDKIYYRIRIKQESVNKMRNIIAAYIIPSMQYKL